MVGREVNTEYYREDKQRPYNSQSILVETRALGLTRPLFRRLAEAPRPRSARHCGNRRLRARGIDALDLRVGTPGSRRSPVAGRASEGVQPRLASNTGSPIYPRERKVEGIVAGLAVYENMTLSQLDRYNSYGVLRDLQGAVARRRVDQEAFDQGAERTTPIAEIFPGGNQQKVVLANGAARDRRSSCSTIRRAGSTSAPRKTCTKWCAPCAPTAAESCSAPTRWRRRSALRTRILVIKDGRIQKSFECQVGSKPSLFNLVHHMV